MQIRAHLFPHSIEEALEMLAAENGKARLISGCTDLVVAIRQGKNDFDVLVDTSRIPDLDRIEEGRDAVRMGTRVTMAKVERNDIIREQGLALAEGCGWVGGPQIRNRATVVGNIVSAQPAADAAIPLFALDAKLEVVGGDGERLIAISAAYGEGGGSTIDPTREMVTAIHFPKNVQGAASAFKRMMRRKALTLPVLNCAVWVRLKSEHFSEVRIACGPVAIQPLRVRAAEESLIQKPVSKETILLASEIAAGEASPRDSVFRGSAAYRKAMVKVLVQETLELALSRVKERS